MSEVLAQLEKKGGGSKAYHIQQAVSQSTLYEFNFGFKPDYVWFRFYSGTQNTTANVMNASTGIIDGVYNAAGQSGWTHRAYGTNEGINDDGFWIRTDTGARVGNIEAMAVKV